MISYNFKDIENYTKKIWANKQVSYGDNKKYFILDMFPYPSGNKLHMGHVLGYSANDILCRFLRLQGYDVLYCIAFDAFGLPAEQYALQTGQHPEITTKNNIQNMIEQIKKLCLSYDWSKYFSTTDPEYYKWTQWIFLQMYESFFDESEIWINKLQQTVHGKAKNISELREYIKEGSWYIDADGIPHKNKGKVITNYTDEEIEKAIDKKRLAFLSDTLVNWCPDLGTVLANEEINPDGTSERGNFPVIKRKMKQWMLRITEYADRLSTGFENLDWPQKTVVMQKNWIGKSTGCYIEFTVHGTDNVLSVFTTKPETLYGVTFIAVSTEHHYVNQKLSQSIKIANNGLKDKVGVYTGYDAIHPITGKKIPIWATNYVLANYGTGAVMGVPIADERDHDFAIEYNINIVEHHVQDDIVHISKMDTSIFNAEKNMISVKEFKNLLITHGIAKETTTYKLRDWLFSRQRYWGEPFPIVHCKDTGKVYPLDESELPVELPKNIDFKNLINRDGAMTPLNCVSDWVEVYGVIKHGKVFTKNIDRSQAKIFRRETNTMPNWAGSCWYYLRYMMGISSKGYDRNQDIFMNKDDENFMERKYASVDFYLGGAEHAVLHYLYARFWHMFLHDRNFISSPEPFMKLRHQGMINAYSYRRTDYKYVHPNNVMTIDSKYFDKFDNAELVRNFGKMGKRYNNSEDPNEFIDKYGNDVLRAFIHFMGPIDQDRSWQHDGLSGIQRFIKKIMKIHDHLSNSTQNICSTSPQVLQKLKKLNLYAKDNYSELGINKILAQCMEFINDIRCNISAEDFKHFLIILSPICIHTAEYIYQELKKKYKDIYTCVSIFDEKWPSVQIEDEINIEIRLMKKNKVLHTAVLPYDQISDWHMKDDANKLEYLYNNIVYINNNLSIDTFRQSKIYSRGNIFFIKLCTL